MSDIDHEKTVDALLGAVKGDLARGIRPKFPQHMGTWYVLSALKHHGYRFEPCWYVAYEPGWMLIKEDLPADFKEILSIRR